MMDDLGTVVDILSFYETKDKLLVSNEIINEAVNKNDLTEAWKQQLIFNEMLIKLLNAYEGMIDINKLSNN